MRNIPSTSPIIASATSGIATPIPIFAPVLCPLLVGGDVEVCTAEIVGLLEEAAAVLSGADVSCAMMKPFTWPACILRPVVVTVAVVVVHEAIHPVGAAMTCPLVKGE